jgi:hypothetical protein
MLFQRIKKAFFLSVGCSRALAVRPSPSTTGGSWLWSRAPRQEYWHNKNKKANPHRGGVRQSPQSPNSLGSIATHAWVA